VRPQVGVVANVEKCPEFIPWMIATRVRRRTDQAIWTDLTVGTGFLRKQFSTIARLDRPHGMTISSHDPVFARTDIRYHVDFRFKSLLL
jgi:coenzyme Q-binding protein COQ10